MIKKFLLLIILFQVVPNFSQETPVKSAYDAYISRDYNKALILYDSLLNQGYYSPELYYNLGNTYYNMDSLGKAMLYYEKALKLEPRNKDIQHNIYLTRRKLDSEIAELPDFFLKRWWDYFSAFFSLNVWTFWILFFSVLLAGSFFVYLFVNNVTWQSLSKRISFFLLIIIIISIFAANTVKNRIYNNNSAVLIKPDSIFASPGTESNKLYDLQPGEKMFIIDSLQDWYRVELLNKEKGWIKKRNFESIL